MGLLQDLEFIRYGVPSTSAGDRAQKELHAAHFAAYHRLHAFIEAHEPWYPPQPEGFGPWIEYKPGDKGPRVNDVVTVITANDRKEKQTGITQVAHAFAWSSTPYPIAAYSVKLDEA